MSGEALLDWYETVRRPLPWRFTRDPWAILVSEVMLQQTQAARVVPHYERFLARFPSPRALAEAPAAEAIGAWSGLGYNRRVLALRAAARVVAERGLAGARAAAGAAGRRPVHGRGSRLVRLGRADGGGRHQRPARDRAPRRRAAHPARAGAAGRRARARGAGGRVEPGDDGARRDGLPAAAAALRGVPAAGGLRRARRPWRPPPRPRGERFESSDRWARGRLLAALVAGEPPPAWPASAGSGRWPGSRATASSSADADGEPRLP